MTVTTTSAPARTDAAVVAPAPPPPASDSFVRRAGWAMAAGALTWSATTFAVGNAPDTVTGIRVQDAGGFAFQVGVVGLVLAFMRTRAVGDGRGARHFLRAELGMLALAMTWTVLHFADPLWADETGWVLALDAFWPLSMLGMFVLGIKVFRARRWSGSLRWAPMIAETWAVVTVPTFIVTQATDGPAWLPAVVGATHLLVGYARLGVLMARHPELTR